MIPVTQTKMVVRNNDGEMIVRGNCWAAVIASILEVPITEVPNVEVLFHIEKGYSSEVMLTFLNSIGWELCTDDRFKSFHTVFNDDNYTELDKIQSHVKDKYYIVSGRSSRGVSHCCIYKNGHLVHDPHPTKEGLLTYDYFETLEKVDNTNFEIAKKIYEEVLKQDYLDSKELSMSSQKTNLSPSSNQQEDECTSPDCDCIKIAEEKNHGDPVKNYPCLKGKSDDDKLKMEYRESLTPSYQQGEWQLCPKCNGTGNIYNEFDTMSTSPSKLCDVCNGAKVLVKPIIKNSYQQGE